MNPVENLLERLDAVKPAGDGKWMARCPSHDDRNPSLSVAIGREDCAVVRCFAGCSAQEIVAAAGLEMRDLFADDAGQEDRATWQPRHRGATRPAAPLPSEQDLATWHNALTTNGSLIRQLGEKRGWTPDAVKSLGLGWDGRRLVFPVRDADGTVVGAARYKPAPRADAEPKMIADAGSKRELWPAPETIHRSDVVWLVEGEPDAVSLTSIGLTAVAIPGVASWRPEWAQRFSGRDVVICTDCDQPGRGLAQTAADDLQLAAGRVRIVDVDQSRSDGHDVGDLVREAAEEGSQGFTALRSILNDMAAEVEAMTPEWPAISGRELPAFPVDALPRRVADWAKAAAEHTQTPVDLPALAALGVLSGAALGGSVVDCGGWDEELGLYLLPAMPSGDRKSTVLRAATQPLREVAAERAEDAAPRVRELRSRADVLDIQARNLTKQIAKDGIDLAERVEAERDLTDVQAELDEIGDPVVPRMLADDATPEALGGLLSKHGSIAVLAAESAFIDNLAGRYSEGKANLHLVCAAYSGEATTIDRKGNDPEHLDRPLLTIALVIQPHVLEALVNHPTARAQGLVARFAYALPETRLGQRKVNAARVPQAVSDGWASVVRRVAATADKTDKTPDNGSSVGSVCMSAVPRMIFSPAASSLLTELQEQIEPRLAPTRDLHSIADWAGRHHGRVARIAGLLHLCEHTTQEPISQSTMRAALRIGEYLLAHGIAALTGPDQKMRAALRWLERHGKESVTVRDLHRGPFGGKGPVELAEELGRSLERLGALRALPVVSNGPGRPKSTSYAVNPQVLANGSVIANASRNGHEVLATPEEEALLERAQILIGGES